MLLLLMVLPSDKCVRRRGKELKKDPSWINPVLSRAAHDEEDEKEEDKVTFLVTS